MPSPASFLGGNRALRALVGAFAGLTVAELAYATALAIYALRSAGEVAVGFVGLRLFVGAVASAATAGAVGRRAGGRTLAAIAAARATLIAASAALSASSAPLGALLVLMALDAAVAAPYRSVQSAVMPALARSPTELASAVGAMATAKTLSQALGAVAGASLLSVTTPSAVFLAAAGLLALSALTNLRLARTTTKQRPSSASVELRSTGRAAAALIRERRVTGILVFSGLRTFVRGMWMAIAVIAALRLLGAGTAGVGLLMLSAGAGALAAVPLSSALVRRRQVGTPTAIALLGCGVPLAVIAAVPRIGVALVSIAAWGVGMAVTDVGVTSLLYRLVESPLLPRATGAIESAKLALEGLGAFSAPLLASSVGVRGALWLAAAPLPFAVAGGWRTLRRVDATAGDRHRVLGLLHGAECLRALDIATLEGLATRAVRVGVRPGTDVVTQGQRGDRFYLVEFGTADALMDGFTVGHVGPGGSFGEKALLRDVARTATVRSRESMGLLALSRDDFLAALTDRDPGTRCDDQPGGAVFGCETRRDRIGLLSRVSLLSHLDDRSLGMLADRSTVDTWPEGSAIVRQGEEGDRFYLVVEGRAVVSVAGETICQLHAGDQFGEIALLYGVPRRADVVSATPSVTLSLHRDDLLPAARHRVALG